MARCFSILFVLSNLVLCKAAADVDECTEYSKLTGAHRTITYYDSSLERCDNQMQRGWYRFMEQAGRMMPTECVAKFHCGAYGPGWLDGDHPMPQDGRVMRRVCFHLEGECCKESIFIEVRNCGNFMVYHLEPPPKCPLRYCGDAVEESSSSVVEAPHECKNHGVLVAMDRGQGFYDPFVSLTDIGLTPGWYRFKDEAGLQMADKCVNLYRCGTHATGWLKDGHPVQSDGAVLREVCFHWLDDCCYFKQQILVRRCKHFYVYEFPGTGKSFLRYCGNGTAAHNHWKKQ
ncbi:uromodulin-like isoform X3 [Oculina patagonica]